MQAASSSTWSQRQLRINTLSLGELGKSGLGDLSDYKVNPQCEGKSSKHSASSRAWPLFLLTTHGRYEDIPRSTWPHSRKTRMGTPNPEKEHNSLNRNFQIKMKDTVVSTSDSPSFVATKSSSIMGLQNHTNHRTTWTTWATWSQDHKPHGLQDHRTTRITGSRGLQDHRNHTDHRTTWIIGSHGSQDHRATWSHGHSTTGPQG